MHIPSTIRSLRSTPLAAALLLVTNGIDATAQAHGSGSQPHPTQPSAVVFVVNCDDDGAGSLRAAIGSAPDGAEVFFDMATMACAEITLKTGQIAVQQESLKLTGPGRDLLAISGGAHLGYTNRVFRHEGSGTLEIDALTIHDAKIQTGQSFESMGGCITSPGTVVLNDARITNCQLIAQPGARGGAIDAGSVKLSRSVVSGNSVTSQGGNASGGGISIGTGTGTIEYSEVVSNFALSAAFPNLVGAGGGIYSRHYLAISYSTIANNKADVAGGISADESIRLSNSTVSSNAASLYGGIKLGGGGALYSSTIVRNFSGHDFVGGISSAYLIADSSVIALNLRATDTFPQSSDIEVGSGYVFGANNLIVASNAALPPETARDCPQLLSLAPNGGATRTHTLRASSPAIDVGNSVIPFTFDQRGISFPRVINGFPDIGATEWSATQGEVIQSSGFESCE
jgi:hypothetical protein